MKCFTKMELWLGLAWLGKKHMELSVAVWSPHTGCQRIVYLLCYMVFHISFKLNH